MGLGAGWSAHKRAQFCAGERCDDYRLLVYARIQWWKGNDNGKAAYSAVLIPDSAATDIVLRGDSSNRVTFLEPPNKDSCTFAGWATESGGDATYHAEDTITLTRNCVFYAVYYWQVAPYIIGFTYDTFRPRFNLTLK